MQILSPMLPCSRHRLYPVVIWVALMSAFPWAFVDKAECQSVAAVYNFNSQNSSQNPQDVALAQGRDGEVYGTTFGTNGYSSIFKVSTSRVFAEIFKFDLTDGCCIGQGITLASDGNFYGVAPAGGATGNGLLFKVSPTGSFADLYDFTGGTDGGLPFAPPIEASDGSLYGTTITSAGGASTVYKYMPSSGSFSTIYQFSSGNVGAPLIQASDGFLYGTTGNGGWRNCGTIFKISTAGILLQSYPFLCGAAGYEPSGGPLLQASDGNFYGTTTLGGLHNGGTIFKMTPDFQVSILYTFMGKSGTSRDGSTPAAGLVQATDGNLYGATFGGGNYGMGTLFQISTSGTYKALYSFNGTAGKAVQGTLMQHTSGLLFGTAQEGGANNLGTVYKLNMGLGPFVTFVQPTGKVGQTVQILGQGLTGTTSVTFNGVAATSFSVPTPTFMLATVPSGATTGPAVVTTPKATLTSNVNFTVVQ